VKYYFNQNELQQIIWLTLYLNECEEVIIT